jgi:hypothetical protein
MSCTNWPICSKTTTAANKDNKSMTGGMTVDAISDVKKQGK